MAFLFTILLIMVSFLDRLFSLLSDMSCSVCSWPSTVFRIIIWYKQQTRGLKVKYVDHEGYTFCYFSRGKPGPQPSILMLHGLSFNKNVWLDTVKIFPKDVHFICLDMPGHGGCTRLLAESYTPVAQAEKIHQFVKCIGLNEKPFHLVGMSMGGTIAGVYATQYPSEVACLSLLCPPGLRLATETEFYKFLKDLRKSSNTHNNPLVLLNVEQGENLLKLGLYNPSKANIQILKGYLEDRRPHKSFFVKCFLDLTSMESRYILHDSISKIRMPTQVIWGQNDKVMDPAGAKLLASTISNCQMHILQKCGHFIMLDQPRQLAKLLLEFHHSVCNTMEKKKVLGQVETSKHLEVIELVKTIMNDLVFGHFEAALLCSKKTAQSVLRDDRCKIPVVFTSNPPFLARMFKRGAAAAYVGMIPPVNCF